MVATTLSSEVKGAIARKGKAAPFGVVGNRWRDPQQDVGGKAALKQPTTETLLLIQTNPADLDDWRRHLQDSGLAREIETCAVNKALNVCADRSPDMAILDLTVGDAVQAGLSFIARLRQGGRSTPVLVLMAQEAPMVGQEALRVGANGCILKDEALAELPIGLREIRAGRIYLSHEVASAIAVMRSRQGSSPLDAMSARQLRIFELLAQGRRYEEIAADLKVSYRTVANSSSLLKGKLGVKTLPELIRAAMEHFPHVRGPLFGSSRACRMSIATAKS